MFSNFGMVHKRECTVQESCNLCTDADRLATFCYTIRGPCVLGFLQLRLQRREVPVHGRSGELGARHGGVLLLRALDHAVTDRLVEEGNTVSVEPSVELIWSRFNRGSCQYSRN